MSPWERIIFHVDMDAFFASVEQRDFPKLQGKPVIVGGAAARGVVSTCSYEARKFGIHSAMPIGQARKLCPQGIFVPGRMHEYVAISRQLMHIFSDFAPQVEPLSLDEAFLDMSGTEALLGPPEKTAKALQKRVWNDLHLHCSVGVAPNKYIAKVASDLHKPRGLTLCYPQTERTFLAPLPIERMWGVGAKTVPRFHALGLLRLGDVQSASLSWLESKLGAALAHHAWHLANGLDPRKVQQTRKAKSIGAERTFAQDLRGAAAVETALLPLVDEIAAGLRQKKLRCQGIRLKVKFANFQQITRQMKLLSPAQDAFSLHAALRDLLQKINVQQPMRLVGAAAFDFIPEEGPMQMSLLDEGANTEATGVLSAKDGKERFRQEALSKTLDAVKKKFGKTIFLRGNDLLRKNNIQKRDRF